MPDVPPAGRLAGAVQAALAMVWAGNHAGARSILEPLEKQARDSGALDDLPAILIVQALLAHRTCRWREAVRLGEEAIVLARQGERPDMANRSAALLAMSESVLGPAATCHARCVELLRGPARSDPVVRMGALAALGLLELGEGRFEEATRWLEVLAGSEATAARDHPGLSLWRVDLAEAYVRAGQPERAAAVVEQLERSAVTAGTTRAKVAATRIRAMIVSSDEEAEALFLEVLRAYEGDEWRFGRARVQLARGMRRRSAGDLSSAKVHLADARALFDALGAHGWRAQVERELCALDASRTMMSDTATLTTQEEQAAMAAVMGGSSAEIARALFVDEGTAVVALQAAATKLGVTDFQSVESVSRVIDVIGRLGHSRSDPSVSLNESAPASRVARPEFQVRLLGGLRVILPDGRVATPTGLAGQVIECVALKRVAPVEELIEGLWPEARDDVGRARFRTLLNRVRDAIGPIVLRQGAWVKLRAEVEVDVERFESLCTEAQCRRSSGDAGAGELAIAALGLYEGELLPESRHRAFTVGPRERLRRRYLAMVDLSADHLVAAGDVEAAVRLLEDAIEIDQYNEELYLRAGRILAGTRRFAQAESVMRRARKSLAELDLPLSADAEELARSLRASP